MYIIIGNQSLRVLQNPDHDNEWVAVNTNYDGETIDGVYGRLDIIGRGTSQSEAIQDFLRRSKGDIQ